MVQNFYGNPKSFDLVNQKVSEDDREVTVQIFSTTNSPQISVDKVMNRFSSWDMLRKFVAWMLHYRRNLRKLRNARKATGRDKGTDVILNQM